MSATRRGPRRRPIALRVLAAAKVNLALRVGSRRADGFHDLATLLVPIDLVDEVRVRVVPGRSGDVVCRVPGRPELEGAANLAARAAEAFRARFGIADAVEISIAKRIPVTAGLGGGSSDAAAVLRALARAYAIRDGAALARIALGIGSDVPFFLAPGPAWATGRGERLVPAHVPRLHLALLYPRDPALAIRAGDAYAWLDAARHQGGGPLGPPRIPTGATWRPSLARNDLQGPCFQRHPELQALQSHLEVHGASPAIMSGSGPTVFGVLSDRAAARRVATTAARIGIDVEAHVARTMHRHPGVTPWKSPRSASSRSPRRSSRPT